MPDKPTVEDLVAAALQLGLDVAREVLAGFPEHKGASFGRTAAETLVDALAAQVEDWTRRKRVVREVAARAHRVPEPVRPKRGRPKKTKECSSATSNSTGSSSP